MKRPPAQVNLVNGLRRALSTRELEAVIAHEIGHIRHSDMSTNMHAAIAIAGLGGLYEMGRMLERDDKDEKSLGLSFMVGGAAARAYTGRGRLHGRLRRGRVERVLPDPPGPGGARLVGRPAGAPLRRPRGTVAHGVGARDPGHADVGAASGDGSSAAMTLFKLFALRRQRGTPRRN